MVLILPHAPLSPEEHPTNTEGQSTQVSHITPPRSLFTNPDAERSLPYPFLLQFLTFSPMVNGEQTLGETKTETGDGTGPTREDSADDEDETDDPNDPGTASVIADSNDKEDADY